MAPMPCSSIWRRASASTWNASAVASYDSLPTSEFAAQFQDRMPLVLEMEDVEGWLRAAPDHATALMRPAKDVLQEWPLGKAINNVKNNAPELLA